MKSINIEYSNCNLEIYFKNGLMKEINSLIDLNKKYFIITDEVVYKLYKDIIKIPNSKILVLPSGEEYKNLDSVNYIIDKMLENDITKGDIIINLGGGVISDLGGFVASIYKRGMDYYNIPTTLLSQVDASIGGKTGVDFLSDGKVFKNQIGRIHHPRKVFIDPIFLDTLSQDEYLSGIGEIIKYGLCYDKELFNILKGDFDLNEVIYKCINIKANITKIDEFEEDFRATLNYGHTIGHAVEAINNYKIPHGICVLYGMIEETNDSKIKEELFTLKNKFAIYFDFDINKDELKDYILKDKKIKNGYIFLPVLEEIGKVVVKKVKIDDYLGGL